MTVKQSISEFLCHWKKTTPWGIPLKIGSVKQFGLKINKQRIKKGLTKINISLIQFSHTNSLISSWWSPKTGGKQRVNCRHRGSETGELKKTRTRVLIPANFWSHPSSWSPAPYLLAPAMPGNRFFNTSNHHLALVMPFASSPVFHTLSTLPIKHDSCLLSWRWLSTYLPMASGEWIPFLLCFTY